MVRYTMECTKAFIRELDNLADEMGGLKRTEVFRRALGLLKAALNDTKSGKKLVITQPDGSIEKEYLLR